MLGDEHRAWNDGHGYEDDEDFDGKRHGSDQGRVFGDSSRVGTSSVNANAPTVTMSNYTYNPSFSTGAGANDHAHVLAPLPTNISGVQRVAHVPKRKIGDLDNEPHFANAGEVSDLFCSTTTDAKRRRLDFSNLDGDAQCSSGLEDQHNKDRDAAGHGISVMQTNLAIDLPEPSPLFPGEDEFLLDLFGDDISYGFEPGTDLTAGLELGGEEYNFDWDEVSFPSRSVQLRSWQQMDGKRRD